MLGDPRERSGFPADFTWGVATAASQIEGVAAERGESIWDRFCATSGRYRAGEGPAWACDHCERFADDIELLRRLGVRAYAFSIAWPRILQSGRGKAAAAGIEFYERLLEGLLDAGIEPFVTLYHGDLPQALQDRGGWPNRDTARYFADFAAVCGERFADRVERWITVNDPWGCAFEGYGEGVAAPGIRDGRAAWLALHHLLMAHAEGASALREVAGGRPGGIKIGISVRVTPVYAEGSSPDDDRARDLADAYLNRSVLDPLFRGSYPEELTPHFSDVQPRVAPPDRERLAGCQIDFVGIKYFTCRRVKAKAGEAPLPVRTAEPRGPRTATGWEILPAGLREAALRLASKYGVKELYVAENGSAFEDVTREDGAILDTARIDFIRDQVRELHAAIAAGAPLKGYFLWTLLDGFEGRFGFRAPFGVVACERDNQFHRRPKASFAFYASLIEANELP